jgi:hypothetical protein
LGIPNSQEMGKVQCMFKSFRRGDICGYGAVTPSANLVMLAQFFLKNPGGTKIATPRSRERDSSGNRERQMTDGHEYRQRGNELAQRARQVEAPELRLIYLGLAAGYGMLARFHERTDWRAPPGAAEERAPKGAVNDAESRED